MVDRSQLFLAAKAIQEEIFTSIGPPPEGLKATAPGVIPAVLFRGAHGYLIKVANQANGAYSNGWYDACAVMLRRLIETLIIESFEKHGISDKIKNKQGDFYYLRDLICNCSPPALAPRLKLAIYTVTALSIQRSDVPRAQPQQPDRSAEGCVDPFAWWSVAGSSG